MNLTCRWCWRTFHRKTNRGVEPLYCRRSHRQRAYEARHGIPRSKEKPGRRHVATRR